MADVTRGYVTGMIGDITRLHAQYYHQHWGFGCDFEARVAQHIAEFMQRYDESRDGIWTISHGERVAAVILIDGTYLETDGAHLRYFLVDEAHQGKGMGRQLMQAALAFCDNQQFKRLYLKTLEGMTAARHLYTSFGFICLGEPQGDRLHELYYERFHPAGR